VEVSEEHLVSAEKEIISISSGDFISLYILVLIKNQGIDNALLNKTYWDQSIY
jgi:hypothetical protein